MLPDVALLEIFDFCLGDRDDLYLCHPYVEDRLTAWYALVHVSRMWRNVVFGSPLRLNLRLYCVPHRTPVKETMVTWPPLPIIVSEDCDEIRDNEKWADNMVAVFEHSDRICRLNLAEIRSWQLENASAAMQEPFQALTHLSLCLKDGETAPILPNSFLGGSAPCLQDIFLCRIPFPGLPTVSLSTTHLVNLCLLEIPHSGYISPEAMVTSLSVLTTLEKLTIGFKSPQSRPDQKGRRPPPQTRTLLPILTRLQFEGVSEYLEDLVVRIDAPLLNFLRTTFFHQLTFDTPRLTQFISRCAPKFKTLDEARLEFFDDLRNTSVGLWSQQEPHFKWLIFGTPCNQSDWQLSFLTQACGLSLPQGLIPTVKHLYIREFDSHGEPWQDDIEGSQWLELLHPFTAVKALYLSWNFTPRIAPALQELVGESVAEVLPALQTLFLEEPLLSGPVGDAIDQFVAARQLAGRPVAVSRWRWENDSEPDESSYENGVVN